MQIKIINILKGLILFLLSLLLGLLLIVGVHVCLTYSSLDGMDGIISSAIFWEDTEYASGYSDKKFKDVEIGMDEDTILKLLGLPLKEGWSYKIGHTDRISFLDNVIVRIDKIFEINSKIKIGMSKEKLLDVLGNPYGKTWVYSRTKNDGHYRARVIVFENDKVVEKIHHYYVD